MTDKQLQLEILQRLTAMETHLKNLVGNGQPGIIEKIHSRLTTVERWVWRATGIAVVIVLAVGWLVHG